MNSLLVLILLLPMCIASQPTPLDITSLKGKRVLFITAHPDDVEGYAGGLVASLQAQGGTEVAYLIVTSGNAGGQCYNSTGYTPCDPLWEKEELALLRRKESLNAAEFLGTDTVWRMGYDDGLSIAYDETRTRRAITAYIRVFQPHYIFTHSPHANFDAPPTCNGQCKPPSAWGDLGYHPDHQHVGQVVFNTVYGSGSTASNDLLFPDLVTAGLKQWEIEQLYFFAVTGDPCTHYLDMSLEILNKKIDASALHKSQYTSPPTEIFTWVAQELAGQLGLKTQYAEGYQGWF